MSIRSSSSVARVGHLWAPCADGGRDRSAQVDDDGSFVEPLVAGTRRGSRQLDLSLPLRVRVLRRRPPHGVQRTSASPTPPMPFSRRLRVSRWMSDAIASMVAAAATMTATTIIDAASTRACSHRASSSSTLRAALPHPCSARRGTGLRVVSDEISTDLRKSSPNLREAPQGAFRLRRMEEPITDQQIRNVIRVDSRIPAAIGEILIGLLDRVQHLQARVDDLEHGR